MSYTNVLCQFKDPNGNIYVNGFWSAAWINQSSSPVLPSMSGAQPGQFPTNTGGELDSFGRIGAGFGTTLADVNTITPTPSQWQFNIQSSTTPRVGFSFLVTITGASQDISAAAQAAAAPLPSTFFGNVTVNSLIATGALTAASVNTSVYVAPGGNIQNAINSLPSGGGEIQLSPGLYTISSAIVPKSGTHIRCTNTGWANTYDSAGCVIQPITGNAIWAISGPAAGTLTNFKMTDVTIDLTADSSGLGCVNMVRTLYSEMYNIRCLLPTTGGMDGIRYDGTVFSYWSKCFGCIVLSTAPGVITNTHVGFHYTASANSNWCFGCVSNLMGTLFLIDGGTSQVGIHGGGGDTFKDNCISVQGTARGNVAQNVRCEESFQAPTGAAINIGATAVENDFRHIYVVGAISAAKVVIDSSNGQNNIEVDDSTGLYQNIVLGNANQNRQLGINKTPATPGGFGLDVHGQIQNDNYLYNLRVGDFRLHAMNSSSVLSPIITLSGAAGADTLQLNPNGTGGVYFATTGGANAFGFQPSSFGNALVPASDNAYQLGANTRRWSDIRFAGTIKPISDAILISSTAPTIAAAGCGGGAASISSNNGTAAFKINVGTTPGSACTITMPTAATGWNCRCDDITTQSTAVFVQKQTGAESTTSVTITNFNDVAVATAFVASDILKCSCFAD